MPRVDRSKVPDLPDGIIAAAERRYEVPVISPDWRIRLSSVETIW
jgi:hypothetical protein